MCPLKDPYRSILMILFSILLFSHSSLLFLSPALPVSSALTPQSTCVPGTSHIALNILHSESSKLLDDFTIYSNLTCHYYYLFPFIVELKQWYVFCNAWMLEYTVLFLFYSPIVSVCLCLRLFAHVYIYICVCMRIYQLETKGIE